MRIPEIPTLEGLAAALSDFDEVPDDRQRVIIEAYAQKLRHYTRPVLTSKEAIQVGRNEIKEF